MELTLCYAEQKDSSLYRLLRNRVTWATRAGLECKNVAVVPALLTAPELLSPSVALASPKSAPTSSLHLLLDLSNASDSNFDLCLDLDGVASAQSHSLRRRSVRRSTHTLTRAQRAEAGLDS